jgi:hypothetical protein
MLCIRSVRIIVYNVQHGPGIINHTTPKGFSKHYSLRYQYLIVFVEMSMFAQKCSGCTRFSMTFKV